MRIQSTSMEPHSWVFDNQREPARLGPLMICRPLPSNRLIEIVDSYPGDVVAKYCIAPFARHFFKWEIQTYPSLWKILNTWIRTLLTLLILVYGSLIACNCFNDEQICHKRFNALVFIVAIGFLWLFGYTSYLRRKLQRQKRSSQVV